MEIDEIINKDKKECGKRSADEVANMGADMSADMETGDRDFTSAKRRKVDSGDSHTKRTFTVVTDTTRDAYGPVLKFITKLYIDQCHDDSTFTEIGLTHVTSSEKPEIGYTLPDGKRITVMYNGHAVTCVRQKASGDHGTAHDIAYMYELHLTASSKKILDELILYACKTKETLKINLYKPSGGFWASHGRVQERPAESLVLDKGVLDELFADIDKFVSAEEDYTLYGHPYKRNYLFHGKPGTGKTSLVNVIANRLKRNIYIVCFDPDLTDSGLMNAFRSINDQNAILLLEDIDCVFQDRNANINKSNVSHSALYNALDGVTRIKGLITIVTTNYVDKLDPALVRPGRIDMKLKFDAMTHEQVVSMLTLYKICLSQKTVTDLYSICKSKELTPSTLSGFLFRYRGTIFDETPNSHTNIINLFKKYLQEMTPKVNDNYSHMFL